jgi:hypothetical protein
VVRPTCKLWAEESGGILWGLVQGQGLQLQLLDEKVQGGEVMI